MYKVFLTNFGYSILDTDDYWRAVQKAKDCGLETAIYLEDKILLTYSPISGFRSV
jgi:hypothetical protein